MLEKKTLENLNQWEIVCPYGAHLVREMESANFPNDLIICKASSGVENLSYEERFKDLEIKTYVHSEIDPWQEAIDTFSKLQLKNLRVLYVYGIGLGYFYEAASSWLKESEDHFLVFLEDDIQAIRHFLKKDKASKILFDRQVFLFYIGDENQRIHFMGSITFNFADMKFAIIGLESYLQTKASIFSEIVKEITFFDILHKAWKIDSVTAYGLLFFKNYVPNFFQLPTSYFGDNLKDKFKGIPAVICGAGPSLDKNIQVLSTLSDKAVIIAGGTALNALNAKGVMPHFGAGIDPNFGQYTRLIMNHAYHIPFIYRARMHAEALDLVHGDKVFISSAYMHQGAKWIENKLGIFGLNIPEGFNVLNFSTSLAHLMGCNPIICVGIDLAYSQGNSYASGIQSHALHSKTRDFRTKDTNEELITKTDIHGNTVYTLWKWVAESAWYSSFSSTNSNIQLINATEGGIGFSGVENMTLEKVKEAYLNKSYDIESLVHGEIQNSPMGTSCDHEHLQSLFSKMHEEMKESQKLIESLRDLFSAYDKDNLNQKNEITELEIRFKESDIFKGFYREFFDAFSSLTSLRQMQLARDASKLDDKAFAAIEAEKYQSLNNMVVSGVNQLKNFLKEEKDHYKEEPSRIKKVNDEETISLLDVTSYKFDQNRFQMIDAKLGIHHEEDLSKSAPITSETLQYPSGRLKMELYYKNDDLHGPVTYYSEEGNLLSKTWYIEGKRSGMAIRHYLSQALYSVQAYVKGMKEGVHRYYYESGALRMELPYKSGVLDGEVLLYHRSGHIFRRLNFVNDQRNGKEVMFSEDGKIVTESYYQEGQPIGTTKVWHSNGVLAKEIIYGESSSNPEIKSWDQNGELIAHAKKVDYFDEMAEKTGVIANGLENVADQLSAVAQTFNELLEGNEKKVEVASSLEDSLKDIQEKLELFKQAETLLKSQNENDSSSSKESIWKTPETKEAVSHEIEKMSESMGREMKTIQDGMKKIMEELKKKIDQ